MQPSDGCAVVNQLLPFSQKLLFLQIQAFPQCSSTFAKATVDKQLANHSSPK
jgi:hypothetical protein